MNFFIQNGSRENLNLFPALIVLQKSQILEETIRRITRKEEGEAKEEEEEALRM